MNFFSGISNKNQVGKNILIMLNILFAHYDIWESTVVNYINRLFLSLLIIFGQWEVLAKDREMGREWGYLFSWLIPC